MGKSFYWLLLGINFIFQVLIFKQWHKLFFNFFFLIKKKKKKKKNNDTNLFTLWTLEKKELANMFFEHCV